MKELKDYVVSIPDYPVPGIIFRDITGILQDADGLKRTVDALAECLKDFEFDALAGTESRGFIFGMPLAYIFNKPFHMIRKQGKLPRETVSMSYELEYGTATIEMHKDSVKPGQKVVIVDDLLATGGTMDACIKLVENLGGEVVKTLCVIELVDLKGREKLEGYDVESIITFEGE